MALRNTKLAYGSIAKLLHWAIALLFLVSYCAVYYRHWFTVEPDEFSIWVGTPNYTALQIHLTSGITISFLILCRVYWRLSNQVPELLPGKRWEHFMANSVHYFLYFLMFMMPITGYLGAGVDTDYLQITQFRETALYDWLVTDTLGLDWETFESPVDFIHKKIGGATLVWIVIGAHAGAALFHHFVKRDDVLLRMLPSGIGMPGTPPNQH